ncbi:hypothetical protein GCM10022251_63420 [Phytohabitans flavus]|uniref:Glycosyltransferase RgtA/B/C/D-like domain-containing protein n=1 Tax=Phytohabitans flavus TaxID=1076124 RepID=A0A6F8XUX0_9ACTN|nr:hypothetical protein [Phytohabitans flavus]BCB77625.1 hypothetical protein Pflav_040350 [Phytohabitans flavus]
MEAAAPTIDEPEAPSEDAEAGPRRARVWRVLTHEWTLAVLGGLLLAVVLTWPTLRHPASTIPGDIGDPTLQAWQVAWGGHALLTDPFGLWDSNTFYPETYTYVYSDTLLGYAPFGFFGHGVEAAIVRYNILYVLLYALAFIGAYALVRQLGAGRLGAVVAGLAWAFSPWRLAHGGHMNILSIGGIALSLAMLARGHGWSLTKGYQPEKVKPGWAVAGWLVAAWQISLGFGIGLPFAYFLIGTCVVAAATYGWSWWRKKARPPFSRRLLIANLAGGGVFAVVTASLAWVYLKVVELNPQGVRGLEWTIMFSPPLEGYFTAPSESWFWGERHAAAREQLTWPPEMALLPGITLIVLATAGLFFSNFRARHRVLLAVGALGTALLGLGATLGGDGDPGYITLSKHLPGWDALRTPGRLMIWVSLLLAILAAGAITEAARNADLLRPRARVVTRAVLVIPLLLVFGESINKTGHPPVPQPPAAMAAAREPLLVLPSGGLIDLHYMLWSTDGFPRIANGLAGFEPTSQGQTKAVTVTFPDQTSIAYLRGIGVKDVLVLPEHLPGTPWDGLTSRPIDGLGITREDIDGAVLYRL